MAAARYIAVDTQGSAIKSSSLDKTVQDFWKISRGEESAGSTRTLFQEDGPIALVSLGKVSVGEDSLKEASRRAAALGTLNLKPFKPETIELDPGFSAHATATGAVLANWTWNLKSTSKAKESVSLASALKFTSAGVESNKLESEKVGNGIRNELNFETGLIYGQAQNLARELMELPANRMTPTKFCERAQEELKGLPVEIHVRDLAWAESKKMGAFISVNRGSQTEGGEPLRFLECHYKGATNSSDRPIALVGKGITFDTGGISLKGGAGMKDMRADMGGAATTLSAFIAVVKMGLKVNLDLFIPLTENMPSGTATKPGDIVVAGNGVTIEVDNTDAEGRLVLADALYYATSAFNPHTVVNAATLTGAMVIALGNQYVGTFTNSDELWDELNSAGKSEQEPVWRMPLSEGYYSQINKTGMDLCNTGGRMAGSATAAIFLKRFVNGLIIDGADNPDQTNLIRWAHLDIAGVMDLAGSDGYNRAGMTGRPTRMLIEFIRRSGDKK